jgi:hypothetical protein
VVIICERRYSLLQLFERALYAVLKRPKTKQKILDAENIFGGFFFRERGASYVVESS